MKEFSYQFKNIYMYEQKDSRLRAKYEMGNYQKGSIIQSSVLYCYHMYLLHLDMDRTESLTCQQLYLTAIRSAVWKEGTTCENCQRIKKSNIKYGKFPAKESE